MSNQLIYKDIIIGLTKFFFLKFFGSFEDFFPKGSPYQKVDDITSNLCKRKCGLGNKFLFLYRFNRASTTLHIKWYFCTDSIGLAQHYTDVLWAILQKNESTRILKYSITET